MTLAPVRKQIVIETSQAHAFRVFTEECGAWWPLATHHIGAQPAETAIIEPYVGGRWFERAADGTECEWGKVLMWEPPARLVLSWQIGPGWKYDDAIVTEVEVRFVIVDATHTRVELKHRLLDRIGAAAEEMRGAFDSEGGWSGLLRRFSDRASVSN